MYYFKDVDLPLSTYTVNYFWEALKVPFGKNSY